MSAVLKRCAVSAMAATVLLFVGCSDSTTPATTNPSTAMTAAKPAAPAEPMTAKTAFWPMYTAAKKWAPDATLIAMGEKDVPGFKNEAGKAAAWEATFGSTSLRKYVVMTDSIATAEPDFRKGLDQGVPMAWSGPTRDAMPIDSGDFNTDSDAAYKTATAEAAEFMKSNPDKKLTSMELGNLFKFHTPVWYVLFGDKKAGYGVYINANTGTAIKK